MCSDPSPRRTKEGVVGSWSEESKGYGPYAGVQHAYVRPEDDIHQQNGPDYVKFPETASTRIGLGTHGNLSLFTEIFGNEYNE